MSDSAREKLRTINAVLKKLASDEDLRDDFKLPIVQAAINHWTGKNRLGPEQAAKLQENRRVVYVLQRFQMLQSVCKEALMPVPLDHLLLGKTELDEGVVRQFLPQALAAPTERTVSTPTTKQASTQSSGKTAKEVAAQGKEAAENTKENASSSGKHDSSKNGNARVPVDSVEGSGGAGLSAAVEKSSQTLSKSAAIQPMDVNTMLKIAIAVVVVLTAATVSVLLNRHRIV